MNSKIILSCMALTFVIGTQYAAQDGVTQTPAPVAVATQAAPSVADASAQPSLAYLALKQAKQTMIKVSNKLSDHYGPQAVLPIEVGFATAMIYNLTRCGTITTANLRGCATLATIGTLEYLRGSGHNIPYMIGGYLVGFAVAKITNEIIDWIGSKLRTRHDNLLNQEPVAH